ncbi:unnamed protein product [Citrullus colocynthis]|uniref:RecF/RecN/SMC N-terminal domain-containing protein n=1 Tax=Citrullus colocynthis TaxID=252529 RepID=A0ABP0YX15_9ROSI
MGSNPTRRRIVVPGFNPHFNAITGLNASGKSNILDSICFALGITNLQEFRASNLQEFVCKQGQAGHITNVLNMKPPEILFMLEEAVGTRMYEMKKVVALKTLDKKQNKVDEINNLLTQKILPALEKLRKERIQYMQWSNGNANLGLRGYAQLMNICRLRM